MTKVVIVVTDEDDADTPFVFTDEFPTMDDVLDWFGEASKHKISGASPTNVPRRLHVIEEHC